MGLSRLRRTSGHPSRVRRVLPEVSRSHTGSAMVVFDCIEGRAVQTRTVLRSTARHSKFVRGHGARIPRAVLSPWLSCSSWRFSSFCAHVLLLRARDSLISSSLVSELDISRSTRSLHSWCPCVRWGDTHREFDDQRLLSVIIRVL